MKRILNLLILFTMIISLFALGCSKEDDITGPAPIIDNGLASEYLGELVLKRREPGFGFPITRTDSVTFLTVDNRYQLIHLSGSTNLCNSEGDIFVNKSTRFITMDSDPINSGNCDRFRVPSTVLAYEATDTSLVMVGTSLITDDQGIVVDTATYNFNLKVITP